MMDTNLKKYINSIKQIKDYDASLDRQNLWWTVVAMVGKINNQGLEPQLLDSISETQKQFDSLKTQLINSLISRYLEKVEVDLRLKAQSFIDILNRNLFERTADVGFLATDQALVDYLKNADFSPEKRHSAESRLIEYIQKYSVYMDIALFTPNGELVASLSDENSKSKTSSSVIYKALETREYIEFDRPVDLVSYDQTPLYFIQRVMDGSSPIGVLCMSFKFVDEMQRISEMLNKGDKGFELVLTNESGILYNTTSQDSNSSQFYQDKMQSFSERKINNQESFCFSCQASGYQGYKGLSWVSSCYIPVDVSFTLNEGDLMKKSLSRFSALFPADLNMLNLEINTALTIVVLNGKISSLKNKVQTFLPVLDYFQDIGKEIKEVFSDSINHIHAVSHSTMQEKASFAAQISQEVIDRNLYERANDVRWWALNPLISETLSSKNTNEYGKISQTLEIINDLYTVYTLLFIFDTNGKVIAVSKPDYEHLLGSNLKDNSMLKRVSDLNSTQQYMVSDFSETGFYNEKPTYIYFGAVRDTENSGVIGGIAAVFDSEPEFQAILEDFLPKDSIGEIIEGAFSFVVDSSSKIISSTENKFDLQPGTKIDQLSSDFQKLIKTNKTQINLDGVEYIVANKSSFGYREFKNSDGYENDMTCYVFLKS